MLLRRHLLPIVALLLVGFTLALAPFLPTGIDWHLSWRPAALDMLAGRTPYDNVTFYSPPWLIAPLLPLALLPEHIGRAALFLISIAGLLLAVRRFGGSLAASLIVLASPPSFHMLLNANIDWIPVLGATLPPRWGLFLVVVKPQIGAGIALYWLVQSWREGGWRRCIAVFGPVTIAFLLSFVVFGLWPMSMLSATSHSWNASLWPYSLPIGLALLVTAVRQSQSRYALVAAPCLAPYLAFHSWIVVLAAIAPRTPELAAAVIGLWFLILAQLPG